MCHAAGLHAVSLDRVLPAQESRDSHTALMMSGKGPRQERGGGGDKKPKSDVLEMDGCMSPLARWMR